MPLIDHPNGHYRFLPGIAPYSCGVVAMPGYEIVNVRFDQPVTYMEGFEKIEAYLNSRNRPKASLCAVELRSPAPFSFDGFGTLNAGYARILQSWGLFVEGVNPVARTNVAPAVEPPRNVVVYGFSYTRPSPGHERKTFVVAGGGELPDGKLDAPSIIARGDTSPTGLINKARFVIQLMQSRLFGLGATWADVTSANVYTIHSMDRILGEVVLPFMGKAGNHGVRWYYSKPPVEEIEFEMDLHGVVHDVWRM